MSCCSLSEENHILPRSRLLKVDDRFATAKKYSLTIPYRLESSVRLSVTGSAGGRMKVTSIGATNVGSLGRGGSFNIGALQLK